MSMGRSIPVLLVEDSEARRDWFMANLPSRFRLVHARSAGQALGLLRRDPGHVYAAILLDHDLQEQARTEADQGLSGTHVVEAILRHTSPDVPVLVHSANTIRAPSMVARLAAAGFDVSRHSFGALDAGWLHRWLEEAAEIWEDAARE